MGNDSTALGPVLEFMRLLWALDHQLNSVSKRMAERIGITGPQRLVIRMIGRFPNTTAGHLAGLLHIHPSTLTGVLKRLETRRLIVRKPDPTDARRARFSLTAKGKQHDQHHAGTVEQSVRRVLSRLPPEQITAAQEMLTALAAELDGELRV